MPTTCPRCTSPTGCTALPNGTVVCASLNQVPGWTCVRKGSGLSMYRREEVPALPSEPVVTISVMTAPPTPQEPREGLSGIAAASSPVVEAKPLETVIPASKDESHSHPPVMGFPITDPVTRIRVTEKTALPAVAQLEPLNPIMGIPIMADNSTAPGPGQIDLLTSRDQSAIETDLRETNSGCDPDDHVTDVNNMIAEGADSSGGPRRVLPEDLPLTTKATPPTISKTETVAARPARLLLDFIARKGGTVTARELQRANNRRYPTTHIAALALDCLAMVGLGEWSERVNVHGPKVRLFTLRESLANEVTVVTNAAGKPSVEQPLVAG